MNQEFSDNNEVIIAKEGAIGVITLNRPKALNALTLDMIRQIAATLKNWETDDSVNAVLFKGAGDRAFCAGGDLKAFHRAGMDFRRGAVPHFVPSVFFGEEYCLNRQIFHYAKPTIAFMNGITMGGGYGIAGNCEHRIVTDKTVFAMPETGIGFFPDVGSVYHLLRAPQYTGHFLALTGALIKAGDVMFAGLADFYIPAAQEKSLIKKLQKGDVKLLISAQAAVSAMDAPMGASEVLKPYVDKIAKIFAEDDILKILEALERDGSAWAIQTLETLRKRSPSSVCVAAQQLKKNRGRDFDEVIRLDFILAQRCLERMDLYEGIRAVLIEKDNAPAWEPGRIEDVTDEHIRRYFEPTGYSLDDVRIFAE